TGLGASNAQNPLAALNRQGRDGGFYSTGHARGDRIWHWPTMGDRVHVAGLWIWDRGHPPARTEIHPPRLIAVRRALPTLVYRDPGRRLRPALATTADIYASGDGNALHNNRQNVPPFVQPVLMNDRDYTFVIDQLLPRPSDRTPLTWTIERRPGDTAPFDAHVQPFPDGSSSHPGAHVVVTLPWQSTNAPNTAVFSRRLFVYWDDDY